MSNAQVRYTRGYRRCSLSNYGALLIAVSHSVSRLFSFHNHTMTDETREDFVRVNSTDLRLLKAAQDEIETSVPLGYVARLGAKELIADDDSGGDTGVVL